MYEARRSGRARAALIAGLVTALTSSLSIAGIAAAPAPAQAIGTGPKIVAGWLPYWDVNADRTGGRAAPIIEANQDLFNEVDLFWNHLSASGQGIVVTSSVNAAKGEAAIARLSGQGYKLMMTSTDGSGRRHLARALKDPALRTDTVQKLVAMGSDPRIDGIDLNFETFAFGDGQSTWATTRKNWIAFIKELSAALRAQGKLLSVTVPPVNNFKRKPSSGYWVYAINVIEPYVDKIKVMMYDYSVARPGPIAPLDWVRKITRFLATNLPRSKVQIGVPAYGRDWVALRVKGKKRGQLKINGECPVDKAVSTSTNAISAKGLDSYLAGLGLSRDNLFRTAYGEAGLNYHLDYTGVTAQGLPTTCRVFRTAHLSDARSVSARARIAKNWGIGGIALWTIAFGDPAQWDMIRNP